MSISGELIYKMSTLSLSPKVIALQTSLEESLLNFKDLVSGFEQLYIETETYKTQLLSQKEKCESKNCSSSEVLKRVIAAKDNIIQQVALITTKLNETKNFKLLNDIFKIVCSDTTALTPPQEIKDHDNKRKPNGEAVCTPDISKVKKKLISPKKELFTSIEEASFNDDSISEIEGTPTGRKSPIIQPKKYRSINSTETREKKKCPDEWPTPERKSVKIHFPPSSGHTPRKGRMIQGRLQVVKEKPASFVDLTSSPELSRESSSASERVNDVQKLVKKESSENDDTILPSPTSGPKNFLLSRISCKEKTDKFKRPLSLKTKTEHVNSSTSRLSVDSKCVENQLAMDETPEMEESINILKPNRFPRIPKTEAHVEMEQKPVENVASDESISVLHHLEQLENNNYQEKSQILPHKSPAKRPLAENMNATNVPPECTQASMSLLRNGLNIAAIEDNAKRKSPEKLEPVYKEPTVRKKAEKLVMPAWICEECKTFYGELYKDDSEAISKVVDKCSKHRGRTNPARPRTPEGIWNPRWDVPDDTEEFNRRNNAV